MLGVKNLSGPADAGNDSHTSDASSNNHRYNVHSRYEFIKTLGKGTYGKVKLAVERYTGRKFAVKTLRKDRIKNKKDMLHIRREMKIMSSLHHPNIIRIHEVFENPDKFVIVMEYAPQGELYDYLSNKKIDSVEESRIFFKQIVSAIQYCHKVGVVHRDLKLENILLGENYEIKIADFGLANLFKSDQLLETFCGSPLYASPEIVNGIAYVGPEVDSWSLGVLLYALVYGMMPFDGSDYSTLTRQISRGEYSRQTKHPDAADLIAKMLTVDPSSRASIDEIANHYWLRQLSTVSSKHSPSTVSLQQENRQVDTNANYLHSAPPVEYAYPVVPHLPSYTNSPVQSDSARPSPVSQTGQLSRTVLTPCALENCAHSNCPFLNRPKSILKPSNPRAKPPLQPTWQTQYANFLPVSNHNMFKDVSCGLQAKDSLKLKAKPLGASGKRRVLRTKRDRESGYYSSPERTPVDVLVPVQTPPTIFQYTQPNIKPQLATPIASENFKPRHPLQQESILTNQFCYVLPMSNHQTVPIIEGQSLSFYPTPTPITVNSTLDHGLSNTLPYTLTTLHSEETQQKRGRPVSTYSDSSILSSDSFELCSFESELPSASYVATVASTGANTVVNLTEAHPTPVRPATLPVTIPAGSRNGRCSPLSSGALTPTSAELNHQLSQILYSDKPRRPYYPEPSVLGDEQEDQLRKMMNQLNLDLERACKKGADVKVSQTASAEV